VAQVAGSADAEPGRAVLELAYERLGVPVRFESLPAAEALAASSSGRMDAELQRIDGTARHYPELIQIPVPINYIQGGVFAEKYDFPIRGWHSLRPYRIGIVGGILFAEEGTAGMDVKVAASYGELFRWIDEDQVDVGVMPRLNGLQVLAASGREGIREMGGILQTMFLYHYVHANRGDLAPRLSKVLKQMLLDGTTRRTHDEVVARLLGEGS